jgi:hypothetical protein
MKILFTGIGGSGVWTMRAEQVAATRAEWKAIPDANRRDAEGMDAVVIVKKIKDRSLSEMKAWGGPLVYDALDFWGQTRRLWRVGPRLRNLEDARTLAKPVLSRIDPDLVLCPTAQMASDLAPLGWPTRLYYHHYDPRLVPARRDDGRIRKRVIYHGRVGHLGIWHVFVWLSCRAHGVDFATCNGPQPLPSDVMFAARRASPWISRRWKSNIKAAIALRMGLPFVAWPEAGYVETHPTALWFKTPLQMHRAIGAALEMEPGAPDDSFSVEKCAKSLEATIEEMLRSRMDLEPQELRSR